MDWIYEVHWKTNQKNLGCREAVSSAISWFFQQEPEGIILEDDFLPDDTFFHFCQEMLSRYREDESAGNISGSNFVKIETPDSYYFSKYMHCWGWATWARAWQKYDVQVTDYKNLSYHAISDNVFERPYWYQKFEKCFKLELNTWDYQYQYLLWKKGMKSINPTKNLVSNIGFNQKATHWSIYLSQANLPTIPMTEINHPSSESINERADRLIYKRVYNRTLISNLIRLATFVWKNGWYGIVLKESELQEVLGLIKPKLLSYRRTS